MVEVDPPGRVAGPPAGRFVIVDEADEAGLAPDLGLGEKAFRSMSANDVLGFAGGALAMVFSVLLGIEDDAVRAAP
jgi:hypothetical protein